MSEQEKREDAQKKIDQIFHSMLDLNEKEFQAFLHTITEKKGEDNGKEERPIG